MSELEEPTPTGISRRTVTKAMAWAVPVIAIAAPVPAFAASGGPPTGVFQGACKLPGNACGTVFVKGYVLEFILTNSTGKAIYLYNQPGYAVSITLTSPPGYTVFFQAAVDSNGAVVLGPSPSTPYLFPAGTSVTIVLNAGTNDNSSNLALVGSVSFPWGHTPTPPDPDNHPNFVVPFNAPDTPPEQNPDCTVEVPC